MNRKGTCQAIFGQKSVEFGHYRRYNVVQFIIKFGPLPTGERVFLY